ncbi:hypothetical protein L0P88_21675 [Muricauda sp. SCSIO 64092]|uniref:hypothetical protein n=1 Tax=Allomuricauda sp. SCSIO 64092 TaxID=2908842 RepID=UPI001FF23482|nr:hypothetical protein [Muricauda sp. SCSIO 64092]UOY06520.1 hypothetical protein L0P88_21675 [Muricauda sp. SCSIO 64092]
MNIALSTLVLFFFLIPGIVFRRFYYSEEFSREYFRETFFAVFIATILPSLFFQILWFYLVKLFGENVDLFVFGDIVSAKPSRASFINIEQNAVKILIYNATMFITAGFTGFLTKQIVRNQKWDRTRKFFRFQNSWHYILKGEFFDFPRADITLERDTVEDIEFVFVDAVIEINNASYIYDGILVDYELSQDGGLDTISLTNAQRRNLKDDAEVSDEGKTKENLSNYYPIDGHILVLKYSEIKNLNFTYYTLEFVLENEEFIPRIVE